MPPTDEEPATAESQETAPEDGEERAVAVPTDPSGWRALLSRYAARDLVRLVQSDKTRAARVFAGFRPAPDIVRHPVVLNRLTDEVRKDPVFARLVAEGAEAGRRAERTTAANAAAVAEPAAPIATDAPNVADPPLTLIAEDDERRNRKIKQQRAALRDKDARIAALEAAVTEATRERDAARVETKAAREQEKRARAEAEQARREQERARQEERHRRVAVPAPNAGAASKPALPSPGAPAPPELGMAGGKPAARTDAVLEDALSRLLSRGKHEVVAAVCREALGRPGGGVSPGGAAAKAGMAGLYSLFAQALYAAAAATSSSGADGAEQDRFACAAFLDAADPAAAALCFARALAHDPKGGDKTQLGRLLNLARRFNREDAVRTTFVRLRASSPAAFGRLSDLLAALGTSGATFLPPATLSVPQRAVGPDEIIALSTGGVTARDIASAVDAGDVAYVLRARAGLTRLRSGTEAALADALMASVAALGRGTAVPLAEPTQPIVVDASNVARHEPDPFALTNAPRVDYLVRMRDFLRERRFFPVHLIADANLRFLVDDRAAYLALLERGIVREAPGGVAADAVLINTAREQNAPLVTNDHLNDWDDARALQRLGFLILPDRITLTPF